MWLSVNPKIEREEIIHAAMAVSGWYEQGWSEDGLSFESPPVPEDLPPVEVAALYNNADSLELDIYSVNAIASDSGGEHGHDDDWGLHEEDENGPGLR